MKVVMEQTKENKAQVGKPSHSVHCSTDLHESPFAALSNPKDAQSLRFYGQFRGAVEI